MKYISVLLFIVGIGILVKVLFTGKKTVMEEITLTDLAPLWTKYNEQKATIAKSSESVHKVANNVETVATAFDNESIDDLGETQHRLLDNFFNNIEKHINTINESGLYEAFTFNEKLYVSLNIFELICTDIKTDENTLIDELIEQGYASSGYGLYKVFLNELGRPKVYKNIELTYPLVNYAKDINNNIVNVEKIK